MNITYLIGDATYPKFDGQSFICHCCNDVGKWGKGFVLAVSKRWDMPEKQFLQQNPRLGRTQIIRVSPNIVVCNMVGQSGIYPDSKGNPPIRYPALEKCFETVVTRIDDDYLKAGKKVSLHMPRIGCGLAGGTWFKVEAIINRVIGDRDIPVFVYDLPGELKNANRGNR
jgi:O-acetyl-ADP-ribose deacetylase (regulator of RNase III)